MNPKDVFPRRNLPGESEEWGRAMEDRVRNVEYAATNQRQGLSGANRTSASSLQELSRQLIRLQELYDAIPKVAQSSTSSGVGSLGGGWNTIASTSILVPPGTSRCDLLVTGSGLLVTTTTSSVVTTSSRLVIAGVAGQSTPNAWFPGNSDFRTILAPSWSRTLSVTPGTSVTAELQVLADNPGSYPANGSSYAALSLIATFTG